MALPHRLGPEASRDHARDLGVGDVGDV